MKRLKILFFFLIGSPIAYLGSYLLLVEASLEKAVGASHRLVPHYALGGKVAENIYAPLHKLDTHVRAKYWQE